MVFFHAKKCPSYLWLPPQRYNIHNWKYKLGFLLLVFFGQVFDKWSPKKRLANPTKDIFGFFKKKPLNLKQMRIKHH
jgi:hypothetical protein